MNVLVVGFVIGLIIYTCVFILLKKFKWFSKNVDFYGPLIAIKTDNVSFFDNFKKFSKFLKVYGLAGASTVGIIGAFMVFIIISGVKMIVEYKPEPTGAFSPQNALVIPGVNEFIPATIAVFIGIVCAVVVHEFGHAMLCRVENVKLKSTGILFAIIPIGAFVDPNNEEIDRASIKSRIMIYGAGITNNLVVGIASFVVMLLLVSTCVNGIGYTSIYSVQVDSPAYHSGISPGDKLVSINGVAITSSNHFIDIISGLNPGDRINVNYQSGNTVHDVSVVLAERPEFAKSNINPNSGYIGMSVYDYGTSIKEATSRMINPFGMFMLLMVPLPSGDHAMTVLKSLAIDTYDVRTNASPFFGFWEIVHVLFWIGWMNVNIGIFNAIPMIPLDGGYIFKDVLRKILNGTFLERYVSKIAVSLSVVIVSMILLMYILPQVFKFMG